MNICPRCHAANDDDWPIEVDGENIWGGCQACWEDDCATGWANEASLIAAMDWMALAMHPIKEEEIR